MPAPSPQKFRDGVARMARSREGSVAVAQIAKCLGAHEMTLHEWICQADIGDGNRPGRSREDSAELRELRHRNRLLEPENEVLRRASAHMSQANLPGKSLPLVSELGDDGIPVAVSLRVLKLSR